MTNGSNGKSRDHLGRFAPGNPGGPGGDTRTLKLQQFRQAVHEAFTVEDIVNLLRELYKHAMAGDIPAAREILDRTLGKATQPITSQLDDGERLPIRIIFDMGDRDGDGPASKGTQF